MDFYVNGAMVSPQQALVQVEDAGLQHAVGLFETFSAYHGRVFRLRQHLERMAASARELGLTNRLDTAELAAAVQQTLEHNAIDRARIRLTVTAGPVSLLNES